MRKILCLLIGLYFSCVKGLAQEKMFYSQTELGFMLGKSGEDWEGKHQKRIGLSFQSFHGARINSKNVIGFSVGLDRYDYLSVIPIAMGYRGFLGKEGKAQLFGGLDLGAGSMLLEKKEETEWSKSWYEGGLLFSPMAGFRFPSRKGKASLSMTFAYKRQELSYFWGQLDQRTTITPRSEGLLPPGFHSVSETASLFHSFVFRVGLMY
ncbi:hypothetical protein [Algoriphagus mannitolivorans]|uniref:hypothetical protein n=1 Tax=Algoriphagus mannitolivorans TaxID=226504 RepID=UPI00040BA3AF|nr:hypothetical protein [Algoriphagus mannitolivorans]